MSDTDPIVLIVEDESSLVDIYSHWLSDDYQIRAAESGERALELIDEDVDIMVLDRLMPALTGREVIENVREQSLDCKIVMATAVESNFDLIEAGADAAITKPITKDELLSVVSQMLAHENYRELETEYFDLLAERSELLASATPSNEELSTLESRIEELAARLDDRTQEMDDNAFISLMRD
ncbi:response regulator transcription factor [Halocatena pleomorpha]|uniref:Response regulator n=1 Tax=Halocatena pleomorpha TaxID=1785090 RepID=A0A3P3RF78_9EURY|nr:response regulator [Halocatena pleomorpha]RRJ32065.1 response regulator [Halocatena pleomorpha]